MNNSANTLSTQMLNQTILMKILAEEVEKCPPNGGYCHTKFKCSLHRVHYSKVEVVSAIQ